MTEPDPRVKAPAPADKWENVIPRTKIQIKMTLLPDKVYRTASEADREQDRAVEEEQDVD